MRVLHVNSEKSWRGGEQQMAYLVSNLKDMNIENFICCKTNSRMSEYAKAKNIPTFETSFSGLKIKDAFNLKKFIKDNNIDIVHAHSANAHTATFYASIFGSKAPIVVSKRTDFPVKSKWKFNNSSIRKIICVSDKIKEITQMDVMEKDKVVTVHSGIKPERFNVKKIDLKVEYNLDDKPLIGNCSALAPHKDYFTFIQVAKKMPEANFIIIGSGPMEEELRKYVKENNVTNITFTGFLYDIESKLPSLDLFLITSTTEGLGTSILDAMICEIPVVATKAGGIPEIVMNGKTGLLSKIKDVDSLVDNCKKIIKNNEMRAQLIKTAKEMVINNYTDLTTAQKTLNLYKEVIGI